MIKALTLSLVSALLTAFPVVAAEEIFVSYGPWKGSVRIESLEAFAEDGTVNSNLRLFMRRTNQAQREQFRQALVKPVNVSPVLLSRFLNSAVGEDILTRAGRGITLQGGRNGKYALRAAIIKAAFEPGGLTLLDVLRNLPIDVQLQGEYLLGLARTAERIIDATNYFTERMAELSAQEAQSSSVDFSQLPDLRQPGKFKFRQRTLTLNDAERQRSFYVVAYVPQTWRTGKTPVVILSHGLGSRPEDFEDVAEQLASYGYVVVLPQHPGSDAKHKQSFFNLTSREIFEIDEFMNRPKDVSFVIDELERRNNSEFGGRLDLENVGVAGHSFGGYTALAVAGAEIDFDYLKEVCERPFSGLNISLLVQCRALNLPRETYQFKDRRVKAVMAHNPVNSTIFGRIGLEQIQIPVMLVGGNFDPATPFVLEQVQAFTWLTTPNKYLGLVEGQAHIDISQLDASITQVLDAIPDLEFAESAVLAGYRLPAVVAFFEVHVAKNEQFRPFLSSAYAAYLSQGQSSNFYLISADSQPTLTQSIEVFLRSK